MNETNTSVKVGDIFLMSWGYDQTNVNFFQVTRLAKGGVFVREIGYRPAGGEGFMCENVVANPDCFLTTSQWCGHINPETYRRLKNGGFNFRGRYFARPWDGKPAYNSWYA